MGGLFCRFAAGLLWGAQADMSAARSVRPRALFTIATPHLGVRGLYSDGSLKLSAGRLLTATVSDLLWDNAVMSDLAAGPNLEALARFDIRRAYAPTVDDGIVAYPTAGITIRADGPVERSWP
eukprot:gnl/TRDRNA2_/TRDRNA2_159755_c0_seq1.p1 gnl/TRDRNA2_/TRDRNA2_159755_c0~~gnl/TRDRNA2_/TRDRNA2_159755_c0_seq1.p1  ORF type:complete len:123 (-),score=11.98 gnl/TRDRNA2_/TRDRNA2_159755_c0_seq1:42-410(-)